MVDCIGLQRRGEDFGAHQLLTAATIGLWAWRARKVDTLGLIRGTTNPPAA
jgi:hypothetical protein